MDQAGRPSAALQTERRHLQTTKRAVDREVPLPNNTSLHLAAGLAAKGRLPDSLVAAAEVARRVRRAMGRLAERDREIITLRNFEGLTNGKAAFLLDIQPESAKKRYTRAMLRLQELLREEGLTGGQL